MPVQPIASPRRAQARANFGASSTAYAGLTPSQQAAWVSYANSYPYTDSLGQSIILTAHNMFIAVNAALLNLGLGISTVPPLSNVIAPTTGVQTWADIANSIGVLMPATSVGNYFLVAVSRQQSGGVSFVSTFRQLAVITGGVEPGFADLTPDYVAAFGVVTAGQRVFFRITPVNQYGCREHHRN